VSALHVAADILLAIGGGLLVMAALGLLVRRDVRDRLHYASLAAVGGAPLVVTGLALTASSWRGALKLLVIAALVAASGPALSPVTARAVERATGAGAQGVRRR